MKNLFIILLFSLIFIFAATTSAQDKPIQLSLFNPIQIVPESQSISGFRLNLIYGKNVNVTGFDLGLVNQSTGFQMGVQFGALNLTDRGMIGWQDGFVNGVSDALSKVLQKAGYVKHHFGDFA